MLHALIIAAGTYATVVLLLYAFQRKLIYHPDKRIGRPDQYGLFDFIDQRCTAADGTLLQLWQHPAEKGFPTILYYHGNASHMGNRAGIYAALAQQGFGVLALSYRGFGNSDGSPDEDGIYQDARAAVAFLGKQDIPPGKIILFGESLGTGVAVQIATEYPVGGLVLEAPYLSVVQRAAEIYRIVPVKLLIQDKFDSYSKIGRVKVPLLVFHGELDPTIPVAHGKKLFDAAVCPKEAFYFPDVAHNDFDSAVISSHVLDFARKYHLIEG